MAGFGLIRGGRIGRSVQIGGLLLQNTQAKSRVGTKLFASQLSAMLRAARVADCNVSVYLTDDRDMRELNADAMGERKPTDILSFPIRKLRIGELPSPLVPGDSIKELGDMYICIPYLLRHARKTGSSLRRELPVIAAHGISHLLGHDHITAAGTKRMIAAEEQLLDSIRTLPPVLTPLLRSGLSESIERTTADGAAKAKARARARK